MPEALVLAIFEKVVIPELSAWLASRHQASDPPSVAEIAAHLTETANAIITAGTAFLKEKGVGAVQ